MYHAFSLYFQSFFSLRFGWVFYTDLPSSLLILSSCASIVLLEQFIEKLPSIIAFSCKITQIVFWSKRVFLPFTRLFPSCKNFLSVFCDFCVLPCNLGCSNQTESTRTSFLASIVDNCLPLSLLEFPLDFFFIDSSSPMKFSIFSNIFTIFSSVVITFFSIILALLIIVFKGLCLSANYNIWVICRCIYMVGCFSVSFWTSSSLGMPFNICWKNWTCL